MRIIKKIYKHINPFIPYDEYDNPELYWKTELTVPTIFFIIGVTASVIGIYLMDKSNSTGIGFFIASIGIIILFWGSILVTKNNS